MAKCFQKLKKLQKLYKYCFKDNKNEDITNSS